MKRQRGRNNGRKPYNQQPHNPNLPIRSQSFDSNGPDVRVRGNAFQILEKYVALARDAQSSGDRVAAENYFQHAEHYYRLINESGGYQQRPNPNQNFQGHGHGQGQPPGDQDQRYQQGQAPAEGQSSAGGQQPPQVVMRQGGGMHQPVGQHGGGATVVPSGYATVGNGGSDGQPD